LPFLKWFCPKCFRKLDQKLAVRPAAKKSQQLPGTFARKGNGDPAKSANRALGNMLAISLAEAPKLDALREALRCTA